MVTQRSRVHGPEPAHAALLRLVPVHRLTIARHVSFYPHSHPTITPLSSYGASAWTVVAGCNLSPPLSSHSHRTLTPLSPLPPRYRLPITPTAPLPPPYRPTTVTNAGYSGAVAAATAGRWNHRPPLPSRLAIARLSPGTGRYRPHYRLHWHQPYRGCHGTYGTPTRSAPAHRELFCRLSSIQF